MNRLMIRHTMDKPLPYDAEVEYLESSGTQYIDTGILATSATSMECQFAFLDSQCPQFMCMGATHTYNCGFFNLSAGYTAGKLGAYMSANIREGAEIDYDTQYHTYYLSASEQRIDNTITSYTSGQHFGYNSQSGVTRQPINIHLLKRNTDFETTSYGYMTCRLKYVRIINNGVLVRDMIPVRKGNTGYLYDKVSGRLFGNQGTGSFVVGSDYNPFALQYLTFVPLEDSTFSFSKRGTGNDIEYSIDGGAWTSLASEANTPTVAAGHNIRWRAELVAKTDGGETASANGVGNFVATGNFKVCGNVMSLIYKDNFVGQDELLHNFQFSALLLGMKTLISAKDLVLPAMILTPYCYWAMFSGCTNLTDAPELPATSLPGHCYRNMFFNCTSLTAGPTILPGTPSSTSNYYHYFRMFRGCTSLVTAPVISSTQWGHYSCNEMFYGCTSLVTAPALSTTTLQNNCYANMFYGCTSLTTAPELPATTLATTCYRNMYYNCSNLTYVKMLATNISATNCLEQWLSGVASTGTFVKHSQMTTLPTGASGIPDGWTVVDDPSTITT